MFTAKVVLKSEDGKVWRVERRDWVVTNRDKSGRLFPMEQEVHAVDILEEGDMLVLKSRTEGGN